MRLLLGLLVELLGYAVARLPPNGMILGQGRQQTSQWSWEVRTFNQTLDHFNAYGQRPADIFAQRYLLNSTHWLGSAAKAPIFFFTGAEGGNVENVVGAYGHVLEMAQKQGALVIFMEARFFGGSLPFGDNHSFDASPRRVGLLSVEQMLLDYVAIITSIRNEFDPSWGCPTMAFGGSLAGTLSVMMRVKYPNVVDMSLASSAPLRGYPLQGVDQFAWRKRVTDTWVQLSTPSGCRITDLVRKGFAALQNAEPTAVQKSFNTCETAYAGNWLDAQGVVWQLLESSGEFVYPASRSPIPSLCASAAKVAAKPNSSGLDVMAALLSSRGQSSCVNLTQYRLQDRTPDAMGWDFLSCTEIVHPIGCNNVTDFFPPQPWSIAESNKQCNATWGVQAEQGGLKIPIDFGFTRPATLASTTSRILFAYGEVDPWAVFAIAQGNLSDELPVLHIPGGSHCADMAGSDAADTAAMLKARAQEEAVVEGWVAALQQSKSVSERVPSLFV